jgi:hypothetical protein
VRLDLECIRMIYSAIPQAAFAAIILLIVALTLTKVSLLFFMRRLMTSQSRRVLLLSYILIAISTLWGLASVISTGVNCSPGGFITDESAKDCRDVVCPQQAMSCRIILSERDRDVNGPA